MISTQAAWMAETGWNLLMFAAAMDDEAAVDELLAQDQEKVKKMLVAKGTDMVIPGNGKGPKLRREPLGQKLLQYSVNICVEINILRRVR